LKENTSRTVQRRSCQNTRYLHPGRICQTVNYVKNKIQKKNGKEKPAVCDKGGIQNRRTKNLCCRKPSADAQEEQQVQKHNKKIFPIQGQHPVP